jgi:hypothetical protein
MPLHPRGSSCVRPGLYHFDRGVTLFRVAGYQAGGPWSVVAVGDEFHRGTHGIKRFWDAAEKARALVEELTREGLTARHYTPEAS